MTRRARPGDHGPVSAERAREIDAEARRAGIPIPEKRTGVDTTQKKARRDRRTKTRTPKPDPRRSRRVAARTRRR